MKLVLDTNVLVSGLLQPRGPSGRIVAGVAQGSLQLYLDARILDEYRQVLGRPKFQFHPEHVRSLLDQIRNEGIWVAAQLLAFDLPDEDDAPFLEVALTAEAEFLVTGNRKHFPLDSSPPEILSPREFLERYRLRP